MVISLNPEGWSHRRLCDGSRLPALASNLLAAESEIAAGRIALFTPRLLAAIVSVALTRQAMCLSGLSNRRSDPPWLSPGTLTLCSPDFPLMALTTSDHSLASQTRSFLKVRRFALQSDMRISHREDNYSTAVSVVAGRTDALASIRR